jgi:fatty-acyl-CoA synthase
METLQIKNLADVEAIESVPIERRLEGLDSTYDVIARAAARWPNSVALAFVPDGDSTVEAVELTYRDLLGRVTQAANAFHALGIGADDVISYVLPNLLETHYAIWGGQAAGIVNAVNPLLEPGHIAHILNAVESKVLVTLGPRLGDSLWRKIDAVRRQVPSLRAVLVVGEDRPLANDVLSFGSELQRQPADRLASGRVIRREELASCFHTGGTTGLPKIARHTHMNELADAWSAGAMAGLSERDTLLCGLPLFHVNGVVVTGLAPFLVGAKVVLLGADGFRSKTTIGHFWRNVARFHATFFSAVPTVYSALLATPIDGNDVSSLRYAICGAAAMPPELIRKFEAATGLAILEGYGLTEGTCVSAVNPRDGHRRNGSIGYRIPYQQMKAVVLGRDGEYERDCAADEIGHLVIKGPNVFPGYKDERANRGIWIGDGWLDTGDLARQDADGRFWLTGRQKDLIIRGGHNIDPSLIEEAMMAHPAVELAAAVGKPDAYAGELPVVYVTLRAGRAVTMEELQAHAKSSIPERAAVPSEILVRDALPLTAVGKIFKPELRFDAARRVLEIALQEIGGDATTFQVAVGADAKHGTFARVDAIELTSVARASVEQRAREALDSFSVRYEFAWRWPSANAGTAGT